MNDPILFLGRLKDHDIVMKSSSGGIMTAVAFWAFEQGGVVFGASFNNLKNCVEHIMVDCPEDLYKLRKSKYVWSDFHNCMEDIRENLALGRTVLFIGTPCQISIVKKAFPNDEKLFLLDFFCHGTLEAEYLSCYLNTLGENTSTIDFRAENPTGGVNFFFR